jgi:hypothetical protein
VFDVVSKPASISGPPVHIPTLWDQFISKVSNQGNLGHQHGKDWMSRAPFPEADPEAGNPGGSFGSTHKVCGATGTCISVSGGYGNECSVDDDCRYKACLGSTCQYVAAYPDLEDQCSEINSVDICNDNSVDNTCMVCDPTSGSCTPPSDEEIFERGGGANRSIGPSLACGCFCNVIGFWDNLGSGGEWDPGIGCLSLTYDAGSMSGNWQTGWWSSNYEWDYYGMTLGCDFFCGDGVANPGSTTSKEKCDTGLSLDPTEGVTSGSTDTFSRRNERITSTCIK